MAHAHYISDKYGHKHILRICNTYCFSTATMITNRLLNVTCIRALPVSLKTSSFQLRLFQQKQHVFAVGCRTCFSGLIIFFLFGFLKIPRGYIQIFVGCIAPNYTPPPPPPGHVPDTKYKVSLLR